MFNKFWFTFGLVLTLMAIVVCRGETEDLNPTGAGYADVHGAAFNELHVHGIVYASDNPALNSDAAGNYTLVLTVSEANDANWGRDNFKDDVSLQGSFQGELNFEDNITFDIPGGADLRDIEWTASATVELKTSLGDPILFRDYDEKKAGPLMKMMTGKMHRVMQAQPPVFFLLTQIRFPSPATVPH